MTTAIQTFNFLTHTVRTVLLNSTPWFVAADVCRVLGLVNPTMAMKNLNDSEVTLNRIEGNPRRFNLISESGLYKLVMRSDKPEAREFQDWVTRVVLPAIRKDGMYVMGGEKVITPRSRSEPPTDSRKPRRRHIPPTAQAPLTPARHCESGNRHPRHLQPRGPHHHHQPRRGGLLWEEPPRRSQDHRRPDRGVGRMCAQFCADVGVGADASRRLPPGSCLRDGPRRLHAAGHGLHWREGAAVQAGVPGHGVFGGELGVLRTGANRPNPPEARGTRQAGPGVLRFA